MVHITIVGGGIGGLTAAVEAREHGHDVTLHEAHDRLGGRAWTTPGERKANWGPHVVYSDGPLWRWLDERGLGQPAETFPKLGKATIRTDGRGRRVPPPLFAPTRGSTARSPSGRASNWTTTAPSPKSRRTSASRRSITIPDRSRPRSSSTDSEGRLSSRPRSATSREGGPRSSNGSRPVREGSACVSTRRAPSTRSRAAAR